MAMGKIWAGLATVACLMGATTPAVAGCWQSRDVENAQIRQFDIMLMVQALRCQVKGVDFVKDYNAFVIANKPILVSGNDAILRRFNQELTGKAAYAAYDRFSIGLANQFGNGGPVDDCLMVRAMVWAATPGGGGGSREALLGHAQRAGMDLAVPGGRCPMAQAQAGAALPQQGVAVVSTASHLEVEH